MNLRAVRERKEARRHDPELNVTPVMNVFLILVPFLLLTAVFVRVAVLELSLPSISKKGSQSKQVQPEQIVLNFLSITPDGFQLKSKGMNFPKIPLRDGKYDFETLAKQLRQIKQKYATSEDVIVAPDSRIRYETIVHVMDTCRENGFPNISISG